MELRASTWVLLLACLLLLAPPSAGRIRGSQCTLDVERMLLRKYPSSLAMLDACGKTYQDAGKYSQCINLDRDVAKYCTLTFMVDLPAGGQNAVSVNFGACVPASCSESQLEGGQDLLLGIAGLNAAPGSVTADCREPFTELHAGAIVTIVLCSVIAALMVLGTLADWYIEWLGAQKEARRAARGEAAEGGEEAAGLTGANANANADAAATAAARGPPTRMEESAYRAGMACLRPMVVLKCFSITYNFGRLFEHNPEATTALNGLRVLFISWVILGHTNLYMMNVGLSNPTYVLDVLQRYSIGLISGAEYSVDGFFFLSGFLVTFIAIKDLGRGNPFNAVKYYFHRYFRLTPSYAFTILFWATIASYLGEGPFWARFQDLPNPSCKKYWWTNLLYINNFWPAVYEDECFKWGWYLANDMQFYVVTPLFFLLFSKVRPIAGWLALAAALLACIGSHLGIVLGYHLGLDSGDEYLDKLYAKPYIRAPSYIIGIAFAFAYYQTGDKFRVPKWLSLPLYAASLTLLWVITYGKNDYFKHGQHWSNWTESWMFDVFSPVCWTLALGCLCYLSFFGSGGVVRALLGHHMWTPLARLSYGTYLCQSMVIYVFTYGHHQYFHWAARTMSYYFVGNWVFSFLCSLVLYLAVEKPMMNLEGFATGRMVRLPKALTPKRR